jgi:GNAT superfamily N-acetyltransferase
VLRGGRSDAEVAFSEDEWEGAFHLGARDGRGALVGVATLFPSTTMLLPRRRAYQLRGMAVDDRRQGEGIGRKLLLAATERLLRLGADAVWANARDSALGFYQHLGWQVVGDGFVHGPMALPHHVVVLELRAAPSRRRS